MVPFKKSFIVYKVLFVVFSFSVYFIVYGLSTFIGGFSGPESTKGGREAGLP